MFVPLFESFMARRGMPDLETLFEDLGIVRAGADISLTSEGRLVPVREAIMQRTED